MFDQISKFNFAETSNTVLDAVVDTNRRVVDAVVTLAERVTLDPRISDALPTPAEAGARYLDFVEQAVAINRDWNNRIAEMIRTEVPKAATATKVAVDEPVTKKPVVKKATAKKPVAKKTAAKKTAAKKTAAKKTAAKKAASPSA